MDESAEPPLDWTWPTGPGADLILTRQRELERSVEGRTPIYLDMNFWIRAREAEFEEAPDPISVALLRALRHAVVTGKAVFPITCEAVEELSKQREPWLQQTATIIDELSLGIAFIPHQQRVAIEVEKVAQKAWPAFEREQRPIWTCASYCFGYEDFNPPVADPGLREFIIREIADRMWQTPLANALQALDPTILEAKRQSQALADRLNIANAMHAHEIDSLETALRIETDGVAQLVELLAQTLLRDVAAQAGITGEDPNPGGAAQTFCRILGAGLRHPQGRASIGSLYVPAALGAVVRAEKRKLSANDIYDHRHAAAALPHCRAFFTDRRLHLMLTDKLRLQGIFDCEIISDPEEALGYLASLTS